MRTTEPHIGRMDQTKGLNTLPALFVDGAFGAGSLAFDGPDGYQPEMLSATWAGT